MAKKKAKQTKQTPKRRAAAAPEQQQAPDWGERFLAVLATNANIRRACRDAGVSRANVYQRREKDGAFAAAMQDALDDAIDDLELEARRRAQDGVRRMKFHQGQPIMVPLFGADGSPVLYPAPLVAAGEPVMVPYLEHEYSDVLTIFLLKAHRPDKYRETVAHRHSGPDGKQPIPVAFIEVNRGAARNPAPDRADDEGRQAGVEIQLPSGATESLGQ